MACRTYQFVLKTAPRHRFVFEQWVGCRRYVWNTFLFEELRPIGQKRAEEKAAHPEGKAQTPYPSHADLCKKLTEKRKAFPWLAETPVHLGQQAAKDLTLALSRVKDGGGFPKPKRKGHCSDSFRLQDPNTFRIDQANARIKLPKLGWIRYRKSQDFSGTPKTITILRRGNHWIASIQVELPEPASPPIHPHANVEVGIDRGVKTFASLSNGEEIAALSPLKAALGALRVAQRALSRKQKGGTNWKRAAKRVRALHARVRNLRRDFLHKESTKIAKSHGVVYVEDLNIQGMSASAAGTQENPGVNVRAKAGLNRAILDQGWYGFEQMLAYKLEERGGRLIRVPAAYTSQRCSACGHVARENRPTRDRFCCVRCGHTENADFNAAKNILGAGQALKGASKEGHLPQRGRAHEPARSVE